MNENLAIQPVIFVSTTQLNLKNIDEEGNLHFIACQNVDDIQVKEGTNHGDPVEEGQGLACVTFSPQPKRLYEIALNFVGQHIEYVQSLELFPSVVGKELFEIALKNHAFNFTKYNIAVTNYILSIFIDAYSEEFLLSLNFSNRHSLLVINCYSDSLYQMMKYVQELDLSDLQLGDNHDLFEHFAKFNKIRSLSLKNNCLSNIALRQLTLPTRMFGRGVVHVEHLDISANPKITEESIIWLFCFKKLKTLDISDCSLNESKIMPILQQNNFSKEVHSSIPYFDIKTSGWAKSIIDLWVGACEQKLLSNANKTDSKPKVKTFYKNRKTQTQHTMTPIIKKYAKTGVRTVFTRRIEKDDDDEDEICEPVAKKVKPVTTGDHCYSNVLMLYQGDRKHHTKNDVQSVFDAIGK